MSARAFEVGDLLADLLAVGERDLHGIGSGRAGVAVLVDDALDRVEAVGDLFEFGRAEVELVEVERDKSNADSSTAIAAPRRLVATGLRFPSRSDNSASTDAIIFSRSSTEPSAS